MSRAGAAAQEQRAASAVLSGEAATARATLRSGIALSPELVQGMRLTLLLALAATAGRVLVPIAVQQTVDSGINSDGGPDVGFVVLMAVVTAAGVLLTGVSSALMTARLFRAAESGLATLRVKAFRHVHDLPVLTQNTERRGALVSRVTSDVDQVSQFLVFGGVIAIVSVGQIVVATAVMLVYSWQLTLVVWLAFLPLFVSLRYFQRRLSEAYATVRRQVGALLSAVAEPVVGAAVVRSYAVEARTQDRIDEAVQRHLTASSRAQGLTAFSFSLGGVSAGLANAGVIAIGVLLGVDGRITAGTVLAFAFLVTLFVGPVQIGTQVLTDAQNAFAGWRRVIGILETPADVSDPGPAGTPLPDGDLGIEFDDVCFAYPGGAPVLDDIDLRIAPRTSVAVVGETGSGKTTLAKLLTRLMDPGAGAVRLGGVDLREVPFASLRERVVLVPQEGFLFDASLRENLAYGRIAADDATMLARRREPRPVRLAQRPALRPRHPGRATRRVPVVGRAPARGAGACPAGRPRRAGARRGDQCGRSSAGDADLLGPGPADLRAHVGHDRAPDDHRGAGRPRRRRRPRAASCSGEARPAAARRAGCTAGCGTPGSSQHEHDRGQQG